MLDINKIKKLIALANNNPNEHEANLATRMVCRMLNDYSFSNQQVKTAADKIKTPTTQQQHDWTFYDEARRGSRSSQQRGLDKRNLKCNKCGTIRETTFVGLPEIFICMNCGLK